MQSSDLRQIYQQVLNASSSGLLTFDNSGHNIIMATHASMYRYLPITKELAVKSTMYGAGILFIRRSKQVGVRGAGHVMRLELTGSGSGGCESLSGFQGQKS